MILSFTVKGLKKFQLITEILAKNLMTWSVFKSWSKLEKSLCGVSLSKSPEISQEVKFRSVFNQISQNLPWNES